MHTQYTLITDLPQWLITLLDSALVRIAKLTGHSVVVSSVHAVSPFVEKASQNETTD